MQSRLSKFGLNRAGQIKNGESCRARKRVALFLALALLTLRLSRATAEEDTVGYRHEFYREDDNRISIDTESVHFDVGLGSQVRLNGDVVIDAISGATPTGAPPQTKWPFPTFNDLYSAAYQQSYAVQFNQYLTDNLIYAEAGYISFQQLTNDSTSFATTTAPGIATNSATASFQSLTNNPNYRNNKVPLTQMHEFRGAFSIGVPITLKSHLLSPSFSYSEESDYISYGGALSDAISFNNKNTTVTFGYSHHSDIVRDDRFQWQDKTSDDGLIGLTQLITPKSYLTANVTVGYESGYLSDPYRGVMPLSNFLQLNPDDAALLPEKRPEERLKEIVYLGWNQFVDPLQGGLEFSYRYFHDSWEIHSHTVDLWWHQKIGKRLVISPEFRYNYQTAADFYYVLVPDFNSLPPAYSSDYRLSELQTFTYAVRVTWRVHKYVSLDAAYMRYVMEGLDGITSQSAYPSANVFSIGARLWF